MTKHTFTASPRKITGRKVKQLRRQGLVPANIFGKNVKSLSITVDSKKFLKLFSEIGESTLLYLEVEKETDPRPVFVREVKKEPTSGTLLHIVFNQVNLKEKVTAPVQIVLGGKAPAETEKLGILVQQLDEIEISALPVDMPENISVDVSGLAEVGANIQVSDLKLDKKFEVKTDPESIIVQIEALAKEEAAPVPAAPEAEAAAVPVEGETSAKTEASAETAKETPEKGKKE